MRRELLLPAVPGNYGHRPLPIQVQGWQIVYILVYGAKMLGFQSYSLLRLYNTF